MEQYEKDHLAVVFTFTYQHLTACLLFDFSYPDSLLEACHIHHIPFLSYGEAAYDVDFSYGEALVLCLQNPDSKDEHIGCNDF